MSLAERAKATVAALVEIIPPARYDRGAVFQHINEVGPANRREPMRDDDYRQTAAQRLNRAEHARLVVVIEAVGGLVENQQSGAAQECTRQRDTLAFALGEQRAALAHHSIQALRQRPHEVLRCGEAQ